MKITILFFGIFFISYNSNAQSMEIMPIFSNETFDINELKDSNFHHIKVWKHTQEFDFDTTTWEPNYKKMVQRNPSIVYEAIYDNNYNLTYEFLTRTEYSKNYYTYNNSNQISSKIITTGVGDSLIKNYEYDKKHNLKKMSVRNNLKGYNYYDYEEIYDEKGNILKSLTKNANRNITERKYKYNDFGKSTEIINATLNIIEKKCKYNNYGYLTETIYDTTFSSYLIKTINFYDDKNRIYKMHDVYKHKNRDEDSLITHYTYDDNGRITSKIVKYSNTFTKHIDVECGMEYTRFYTYDSLIVNINAISRGGNNNEVLKQMSKSHYIVYNGYGKIYNKKDGFDIEVYEDVDLTILNEVYYSCYKSPDNGNLKETSAEKTKLTEYLNSKSKLPFIISYHDNVYQSDTYYIEYSK